MSLDYNACEALKFSVPTDNTHLILLPSSIVLLWLDTCTSLFACGMCMRMLIIMLLDVSPYMAVGIVV